jgi:cob(I)alamin adenosyltransferase
MKVYTRHGDDGTTGLFYGGRVAKDSPRPTAYGAVDEAQAALGVARAEARRGDGRDASDQLDAGDELDDLLVHLERDLWVLMAELATAPENRHKLEPGNQLVTAEMVTALERRIDAVSERFDPPTEFVVPGQNRVSAQLDVARTVVRRAERVAVGVAEPGSQVVPYLNRLSDLLWTLARWQEGEHLETRSVAGGDGAA